MKKTALLLLLATCLLQWIVPAKMIWDQEQLYETGITYKIKTIPMDPNDPFRGKYITLNYDISTYKTEDISHLNLDRSNKRVYVQLYQDEAGFAKIKSLSKTPPASTKEYVTAKVRYHVKKKEGYNLHLTYPFNTFFMEETKALKAEQLYRNALRNTDKITYSLVNIQEGNAVLIDVQVDGVSINDLVEIQE